MTWISCVLCMTMRSPERRGTKSVSPLVVFLLIEATSNAGFDWAAALAAVATAGQTPERMRLAIQENHAGAYQNS